MDKSKLKVLVVEDSPEDLESFRVLPFPEDWEIDYATSFTTAHNLINTHKYMVVFLDVNLPDGDGIMLLEAAGGSLIKVILTGVHDAVLWAKCKEYGATHFIVKPLKEEYLEEIVWSCRKD